LWSALDLAELIQLGVGALFGAILAIAVRRNRDTASAMGILNVSVCTAIGILTMVHMRWPHLPVLIAVGFFSSAAPLTLTLASTPSIESTADALQYLRRAAGSVTLHMLYGIGFAVLGFVGALSTVLAIAAAT
jgi:hypothetical protein